MAFPPPLGPALERLEGALQSLEAAIEAEPLAAPAPGDPVLISRLSEIEDSLDALIVKFSGAVSGPNTGGKQNDG